LLADATLSGDALAERLVLARDAGYWRRMGGLSISDGSGAHVELDPAATAATLDTRARAELYEREGYFRTPQIVSARALARLLATLSRLRDGGWPPVFAFVFDDFWLCARLSPLRPLLERLIGPCYQQIPHVWTHAVPGARGAAGWPPHIDGDRAYDGRLTIWLALTDATLENGCMHIVTPAALSADVAQRLLSGGEIPAAAVCTMLHGVRALPVSAGTALGWGFDRLHWGGHYVTGPARVSLSFEFLAESHAATDAERPLVDPGGALPTFEFRLRAIADGLVTYAKFDAAARRFAPLGRGLLAASRP
jgi:hypothetical protein